MLSVLASKGLVLGVLFIMTFGLGLIPVRLVNFIQHQTALSARDEESARRGLKKQTTYKRVMSFLSCFAAGVFLATCFLDLLPEVRKKLTTVFFSLNIMTGFPLAEFIMSWGLFFILIIEQIVLATKEQHHREELPEERRSLLENGEPAHLSHRPRDDTFADSSDEEQGYRSEHSIVGITDQPDLSDDDDDDIVGDPPSLPVNRPTDQAAPSRPRRPRRRRGRNYGTVSDSHLHHHDDHHNHGHDVNFQKYHSPVRALILLMAISLHSIFEGLAVGLQSNAEQVLGIFGALVMHKSILSFSIGMNLVQSKLSTQQAILSIFFFAITSPFGVALGMLITNMWQSTSSNLADGILQGIACGTFLFMTFFEVMPAEFNSAHDRMLKLLMLLLGYSVVTSILFFSDDVKAPFCKTINTDPS